MCEMMGSTILSDYADAHMRDLLISTCKLGSKPFQTEGAPDIWKAIIFSPAQLSLALRVQRRAAEEVGQQQRGQPAGGLPGGADLAEVMQQYFQAQM